VSYNEVGLEPDKVYSLMLPPAPEDLFPVFARLSHQNPILAEFRRTGDGRPRRFSDLIDQASYVAPGVGRHGERIAVGAEVPDRRRGRRLRWDDADDRVGVRGGDAAELGDPQRPVLRRGDCAGWPLASPESMAGSL
jgi:hypothetical protein